MEKATCRKKKCFPFKAHKGSKKDDKEIERSEKPMAKKTHIRSKRHCLSSCCWKQKTANDQGVASQSDDQSKDVSAAEVETLKEPGKIKTPEGEDGTCFALLLLVAEVFPKD